MKQQHLIFEKEKISSIAKSSSVLDVGGGARFTKWLKKYEALFKNTEYKTLDYNDATNPDIVGDIHAIPLGDEAVEAIICYSVLEHVRDPRRAIEEMHRILSSDGKILVYVPSIYPYHASKGKYPDYWRFFDDTLEDLFSSWSNVEIVKVGGYFKALSFFIPLQHKFQWLLGPVAYMLDTVFRTNSRTTTSGYILYAEK